MVQGLVSWNMDHIGHTVSVLYAMQVMMKLLNFIQPSPNSVHTQLMIWEGMIMKMVPSSSMKCKMKIFLNF